MSKARHRPSKRPPHSRQAGLVQQHKPGNTPTASNTCRCMEKCPDPHMPASTFKRQSICSAHTLCLQTTDVHDGPPCYHAFTPTSALIACFPAARAATQNCADASTTFACALQPLSIQQVPLLASHCSWVVPALLVRSKARHGPLKDTGMHVRPHKHAWTCHNNHSMQMVGHRAEGEQILAQLRTHKPDNHMC